MTPNNLWQHADASRHRPSLYIILCLLVVRFPRESLGLVFANLSLNWFVHPNYLRLASLPMMLWVWQGKLLVAKVETILLNRANKFSLPRGNEDKKRMETTQKKPPPAGTWLIITVMVEHSRLSLYHSMIHRLSSGLGAGFVHQKTPFQIGTQDGVMMTLFNLLPSDFDIENEFLE